VALLHLKWRNRTGFCCAKAEEREEYRGKDGSVICKLLDEKVGDDLCKAGSKR